MTYRIPAGIPRREPVRHYPEGYSPETMVVIGWNKHETLEIEKPHMYVRQEWDAICKPADAKPTDAHTEIVEAAGSQNCLPGCIAGTPPYTSTSTRARYRSTTRGTTRGKAMYGVSWTACSNNIGSGRCQ